MSLGNSRAGEGFCAMGAVHGIRHWGTAFAKDIAQKAQTSTSVKEPHWSGQTPNHRSSHKKQALEIRVLWIHSQLSAITDQIHTFLEADSWNLHLSLNCFCGNHETPKWNSAINTNPLCTPTSHILNPEWREREAALSFSCSDSNTLEHTESNYFHLLHATWKLFC